MTLTVENTPRLRLWQLQQLPDWDEIAERGRVTLNIVDAVEVDVELTSIRTGFGQRTLFRCPRCQSSRLDLFLVDGALACRRCHRLPYLAHTWPRSRWRDEIGRPAFTAARLARRQGLSC